MTSKEQKQAEKLLQRNGIGFHDIGSFSFMKRYYQMPRKSNLISKDKYGAGVLTLHLNKGTTKAIYLPLYRHPTAVIHYLLSREIPFENYKPGKREAGITIPEKKYRRSSLYLLYFASFVLSFIKCFIKVTTLSSTTVTLSMLFNSFY